jgi:hypothetical protein
MAQQVIWCKPKNKNLFDEDKFWCPFCNTWKPGRSSFLAEHFKDRENTNWVAQVITEIKGTHFKYNYHKRIKQAPEMVGWCNCKALNMMLDDEICLLFIKKNKISVDDMVKACREINPKLKSKVLKKLGGGLVWK